MLWGIDLGGTKIEGVILQSLHYVNPLVRTRVDTEAGNGYDHVLRQIEKLVRQMTDSSGLKPTAIGIGTPGVLDPVTLTLKGSNSVVLNGKPLRSDIENALGLEVVIANDANCFALAETHWGVVKEHAPGARVVFGIIMGSGVGGGIIVDGKMWNGRHGIAGEWGHNFLDDSGGPCYCGKTGCVETILSGTGLQRFYTSLTGEQITLKEIVRRQKEGRDEAANKTIARLTHFFGKAASVIVNLLDPDVIVVGGGVGNIDNIYTEGCDWLRHFIFNNSIEVPVLKPKLGDSAGVFGAAALVAK